jgi:hypothetical protein
MEYFHGHEEKIEEKDYTGTVFHSPKKELLLEAGNKILRKAEEGNSIFLLQ